MANVLLSGAWAEGVIGDGVPVVVVVGVGFGFGRGEMR